MTKKSNHQVVQENQSIAMATATAVATATLEPIGQALQGVREMKNEVENEHVVVHDEHGRFEIVE